MSYEGTPCPKCGARLSGITTQAGAKYPCNGCGVSYTDDELQALMPPSEEGDGVVQEMNSSGGRGTPAEVLLSVVRLLSPLTQRQREQVLHEVRKEFRI